MNRNAISLPVWVRAYRFFFAVLAVIAIIYQLWHLHDEGKLKLANYFSFFTIQSNLIAAVVFLIGASSASFVQRPTRAWDLVRGAAAIYMTLTFVVYGLLLSGADVQIAIPWVNDVVHRIFPLVLLFDFLIQPLLHRVTFRQGLLWTIYPMAWLVYTIIRGATIGWYPYPFLDPDKTGGWPGVAAICIGILVGFLLATWFMTAIGQRLSLRIGENVQTADPAPTF
ncbi:MAG: Pr6Pr family membrane protein [Thermomicrobiales bacterium]